MYCLLPILTSDPSVPPQQKPLARSYVQPPDVPNWIGGFCFAVWLTPPPPPPPCPGGGPAIARNLSVRCTCTPTPPRFRGRLRITSPAFAGSRSIEPHKTGGPP